MKDEEDDNIIPNDDENNQDENLMDDNQDGDDEDIINVDAKHFEGQHFYENQEEEGEDVITKVTGMYKDWFLDYASYVILERAVPAIEDGFKPVQRRIMHSLKELDDGRYNKVANVVGHTMQYHPHGDASIGDAMVQIGQKDLLIDCQGNWGNILTGDGAAAPRYIEARLSKFALEVLYSPKITEWGLSYDGRKAEPINLPVKFPMLLAQGAEGIAVGLSTKVLPHNFNELIDASIKILKGKPFTLYPDFMTQGIADVSNYNDGMRGGRVRVRAKISQLDKNTLVITQIPFSTNTSSLIDSILKANDKGKIKIKKIEDNTAADVEILIHLFPGVSPDKTIDALFAFTACETSVAPLGCVIEDNKPLFIGVSQMLKISTHRTVDLLRQELEIQLEELKNKWHFSTLEKIFIREEMYIDFKLYGDRESLYKYLYDRFEPFKKSFVREINDDDLQRLTQIPMIRITRFDSDKADDLIAKLEDEMKEVEHNLEHLTDFAIAYFTKLKEKYGKGRERQTELRVFDNVEATKVVLRNTKLYVNREEGFVGTSLKKDEYVGDCSDIDDVIVFLRDGTLMITKVDAKTFIGKDIIHVAVFDKNDKRTIYNMMYRDGKSGPSYIKRFNVTGVTRDKAYDLTNGTNGSQVVYFSHNPNGEAEVVTILLRQVGTIKKLKFDIDFAKLAIKGRGSKGNLVTKYPIKKIELKEKGISTLLPRKVWFDDTVKRLNVDARGELLGEFKPTDKILIINQSGKLKVIIPELSTHFDEDMIVLEKWKPKKPISAIYYDGEKERYFLKRFLVENEGKEESFITDHPNSQLEIVSTDYRPVAQLVFAKVKGVQKDDLHIDVEDFIAVKGFKALGNQLTTDKLKQVNLLDPLPYEEPIEEIPEKPEISEDDPVETELDDDGQIGLVLE
ncbi:DNA gyrase/topoisomerase IV subunit A [Flavobacterium johnsoniae]|uniref:DNA topoisomerase (ATP-hydrolyzing) n=1 Tax=Flavobacterium johnsoniae (strain ATCC 17061 / DSM 2064 / JCM 8514 / BCRC 14874 / CCUG 350202 / NBRC 14942 / NCIMB 11054 / UW101) TaxID=376686 RepID=A5FH14_FLAJ1|nr:DNA gyrase/topoisomerase IV subunit A [Flavobacterium johnsoniae]ABQ05502.1 DNA topoisomerase (ATP-hydrolyzing) [Flavobacterium johnsoniae UW101]OXE96768.1 DNA topoisomerase IV [Flavobacterium johnsoniae UW101]WQG82696.1 DNA gyrase/topoisomerase IV subunit A [Flavobacterium johnsoniae UW101]SHL55325.1 topoisomerase-4 subunit A [Flavobacterium johnsoniae]